MATVTIGSTRGFRHLWLKTVRGFNDKDHCAKCLLGEYSKLFLTTMPTGEAIQLPFQQGETVYFCGVAIPFNWSNNLHIAGTVKEGCKITLPLHNGSMIAIDGIERIDILPDAALRLYPERSKAFLTCRNFQFGAQHYTGTAVERTKSLPEVARA